MLHTLAELDESSGAATADAATQPHEDVPQKENIDVNESDTAEAEPSVRESWAGKLGKWAATLKPTIAAAPAAEPKQSSPEHHTAESTVDILSADMKQAQTAKSAGGCTSGSSSFLGYAQKMKFCVADLCPKWERVKPVAAV